MPWSATNFALPAGIDSVNGVGDDARSLGERDLPLHRGCSSEAETLANVLALKVGVVSQYFILVYAASEQPEHSRNRDAQTPDAGHTVHLVRIYGYTR